MAVPGVGSGEGVQTMAVTPGVPPPPLPPVKTPAVPTLAIADPAREAPKGLETLIVVLETPGAMVAVTTATTPFAMIFELMPVKRQVATPGA